MIPVLSITPENLTLAAQAIRRGELVAMPTETVYGLAGDALNPASLARIFAVKQRPYFDPLIVHIEDIAWVEKLCAFVPQPMRVLMERCWPGPVTFVLPKREIVPSLATSGLPDVALRMPSHPAALALIRESGTPLAAPSANPFGRLSPTCVAHVSADFQEGIACILDGGPCAIGVESTVLGWQSGQLILLRPGGNPVEALESILQETILPLPPASGSPQSPGALPWHYAPRTPLVLLESYQIPEGSQDTGLLWFGLSSPPKGYARVEHLAHDGNWLAAAADFFAALHRLDRLDLKQIVASTVPESGLGRAINDRLRKAAATIFPGRHESGSNLPRE